MGSPDSVRPMASPAVDTVTDECLAAARKAGWLGPREQLRAMIAKLPAASLAGFAASYAHSCEEMRAMGFDLNDPDLFKPVLELREEAGTAVVMRLQDDTPVFRGTFEAACEYALEDPACVSFT